MSTDLLLPPLRFKGERSYIQGPDLFNAMQVAARERLGRSAWVERAVIREMATGPVEVAEGDVDAAKGVFDVREADERHRFSLVDAVGDVQLAREPYDESMIVEGGRYSTDRGTFEGVMPHTVMEVVTSLAKTLHNRELPVSDAKWIWVGVALDRALPDVATKAEVVIRRRLGSRLTMSDLVIDGDAVGSMTFAARTL